AGKKTARETKISVALVTMVLNRFASTAGLVSFTLFSFSCPPSQQLNNFFMKPPCIFHDRCLVTSSPVTRTIAFSCLVALYLLRLWLLLFCYQLHLCGKMLRCPILFYE